MWGHSLERRKPISGHIVHKEWLFLLSISIATSSQVRGKSWRDLSHLCRDLSNQKQPYHAQEPASQTIAPHPPGYVLWNGINVQSQRCIRNWMEWMSIHSAASTKGWDELPSTALHPQWDGMGWTSIHSTTSAMGWDECPSTARHPRRDGMNSHPQHCIHDA